jgi:Phosphorylase superfamily
MRRPKPAKLAVCPRLREAVEGKLDLRWSPQQIAAWPALAYPDDPEMRVGAPAAAGALEKLAAMGTSAFVSVGTAGSLQRDLNIGDLVLCELLSGTRASFTANCHRRSWPRRRRQ